MGRRRRARIKRKIYHWSDLEIDSSSDEDANVEVPEASTSEVRGKQKAATKRSSVRITKKGKLGMIAEMPLDVLYEIFYFLTPRDLVRISWTSKHFRRVLTSRSTRNIWRAALRSVEGLPQCPPYMNEIEYSTLLYHVGCYGCGRARPPVNWYFRRRICKRCLPDQVYTGEQMWDRVLEAELEDELAAVRLGDSLELGPFLGYDLLKVEPGRNGKMFVTLRDDVNGFLDACQGALDAGKDMYDVVKVYEVRRQARRAHTDAIIRWEEDQALDREDALDLERSRRYQQILERLEDEGWDTELHEYPRFYDGLKDQPGVKVSKALTDKGWEHVKGPLIAYLVEMREKRLEEQRFHKRSYRITTLWKRVSAFRRENMTPQDFFPTEGVFTSHPLISKVIDYGDDEAFEQLQDTIAEKLPEIREGVQKDREEALLKLLPPGYTSPEPLKLATTWFSNTLVSRVGRVENMIAELWCAPGEEWDLDGILGGICWDTIAPSIVFEKKVKDAVTKLITDLGVGDPEEMTVEELDSVRCRVAIFTKKDNPILNVEVGSWRHLVQKIAGAGSEVISWRVLEDQELPDVTSVGQPPIGGLWECVYCWRTGKEYRPGEPAQVERHLQDIHEVDEPTEGTDYWLLPSDDGDNFNVDSQCHGLNAEAAPACAGWVKRSTALLLR